MAWKLWQEIGRSNFNYCKTDSFILKKRLSKFLRNAFDFQKNLTESTVELFAYYIERRII